MEKKLSEDKVKSLEVLKSNMDKLQVQMLQITAQLLSIEERQKNIFDMLRQKENEYKEILNAGIEELGIAKEDYKNYKFTFNGVDTFTGEKIVKEEK